MNKRFGKAILVSLFVAFSAATALAEKFALPFSVQIGGQDAAVKADTDIVATLPAPVSNDAAIAFGTSGMTIVNITASDASGNPSSPTAQPKVIVAQDGKATLKDTMDKTALTPGTYVMNAVGGGKTARVVFTVK